MKIVEKTGATINSTRKFVWAGQEKVEFRDAADAVTMRIFAQGQHNGTTPYFFTRDHLGSGGFTAAPTTGITKRRQR